MRWDAMRRRSWCVIKRHVGGNEMSLSSLHYAFVFHSAFYMDFIINPPPRRQGSIELEKVSKHRQLFFFYFSLGEHTHYGDTAENRDTIPRLLCSLFPYNILIRRFFVFDWLRPTSEPTNQPASQANKNMPIPLVIKICPTAIVYKLAFFDIAVMRLLAALLYLNFVVKSWYLKGNFPPPVESG